MARIRAAGGIVLGKTNLSQWGMARSPKCPSGWTAIFGQTLGAFHESQDPQGSSSGSAVAMSLNLASGAIGAEVTFSTYVKLLIVSMLTSFRPAEVSFILPKEMVLWV